jgi:WD40 repeat protein
VGVAFTPDGRRVHLLAATLARSAPDSAARWTVTEFDALEGAAGDPVISGTLPASFDALAVDFTDDGSSAVLWSLDDPTVAVLIDLSHGRQTPIPAPDRPGRILDFRTVGSGAARLWDDGGVTLLGPDGSVRQQLDAHQEPVRDVVISPDGTWGATVGDGPEMILWDVDPSTGRWTQREQLTGHGADVRDAEVDPTGRRLVTLGLDHTVITWDMGSDAGFGESYPGLDGRWISNRPQPVPGGLIVFPTRPGRSTTEARGERPGKDTVSVAATFLDPTTGAVVSQVELGDTLEVEFGSSVAVSPDRSMVAVTWGLGTTVLDTRTHKVIEEIVLPPNGGPGLDGQPLPATVVWSAGWTPDGSTLLLGAERNVRTNVGGYVARVDTTTWQQGPPLEIGSAVQSIEVSPDEQLIAVASLGDSSIVILDAATLEVRQHVGLSVEDYIYDLSFSPDGRFLAGGGFGGMLHVFDTATWDYATEPASVQDDLLLQVEWLRDGRTVVTAGANGKVSLFDVEREQLRARPLRASGEPVEGYAHLVPGATDELIALSGERTGWRYPLRPGDWLDEACSIVGRNFTVAEWARYLPGRDREPTCRDR